MSAAVVSRPLSRYQKQRSFRLGLLRELPSQKCKLCHGRGVLNWLTTNDKREPGEGPCVCVRWRMPRGQS
jgi:hypothetical protein